MTSKQPTNAVTNTDWTEKSVTTASGDMVTVLTKPDESGNITNVLPKLPRLVWRKHDKPMISLSLILGRQPTPADDNVYDLITRGILTLDVQLRVSSDVLQALEATDCGAYKRLFARAISYQIDTINGESKDKTPLSTAEASGTEGRAGMTIPLDGSQARDVLGALDGTASSLHLSATVTYKHSQEAREVRLAGSWADIHSFIADHFSTAEQISAEQLRQLIPAMLDGKLLTVTTSPDGKPYPLDPDEVFQLFMPQAAVILTREPSATEETVVYYTLRNKPHPLFQLNYTQTLNVTSSQSIDLAVPLHQLIGGVLDGHHWGDFVHLLAESSDGTGTISPVPQLLRSTGKSNRRHNGRDNTVQLAAIGNSMQPITRMLQPSTTSTLATKQSGFTIGLKPSTMQNMIGGQWGQLPDYEIYPPNRIWMEPLPHVDQPDAPYWKDPTVWGRYWYAPVFEVVQPTPTTEADASPFLFTFERIGTTSTGQAALRGTVRFTLRKIQSDETKSAVQADKITALQPVKMNQLTVSLEVPFVDAKDGQVKRHSFNATIQDNGDTVTATVALINDWVRLCYGALAVSSFQQLSPQIKVGYSFEGYTKGKIQFYNVVYGGKTRELALDYAALEPVGGNGQPNIKVADMAVTGKNDNSAYAPQVQHRQPITTRIPIDSGGGIYYPGPKVPGIPGGSIPINPYPTKPYPTKPKPKPKPKPTQPSPPVTPHPYPAYDHFMRQTQLRQHTLPALFPCNSLGHLYRQAENGTTTATGCQEVADLGRVEYRQYEEMVDLRHAAYRVHRSLQQPGEFLVVPTRFVITRKAADETDAYHPLIMLFATLDAQNIDNTRVSLHTTLQPDISPYLHRELESKLTSHAPDPIIRFPTDIATDTVETAWSLHSSIRAINETAILDASGPFVGAQFETDVAGWQLMLSMLETGGILGGVTFTLPDKSRFYSNLTLNLTQIRGPWHEGPIQITTSSGQAHLINRIEGVLDISDLIVYRTSGVLETIPIETSLTPETPHTVAVGNEISAIYPVYNYPPSDPVTIESIRSYVEDVRDNVIFIKQVALANHGLSRLDVKARIKGLPEIYAAQLTEEMPTVDIPILLSLTAFLENRVLEFQVTMVFTSGQTQTVGWLEQDINANGIVGLSKEILGL